MGCLIYWKKTPNQSKRQDDTKNLLKIIKESKHQKMVEQPDSKSLNDDETTHQSISLLSIDISNENIAKVYHDALKDEVIGYVNDLPNSLYNKKIFNQSDTIKFLRLPKEVIKLNNFLPCQHTNSIFVRFDQAKIDSMNVLISGSKDTPYSNGLYHFEVFCDDEFPLRPPKMLLLTGKEKVRFNPNLYQNGKICLSLLGTWRGANDHQQWNVAKSSLFQIFISIQSLIMSSDIYFNEPGYQAFKGSQIGNLNNEGYSNVVKIANIRYAMIDIIKSPPKGFEDVVRKHFYIKKDQILQECQTWLNEKDKPYKNCHFNPSFQQNIQTINYGSLLELEIKELRQILMELTCE